MTARVVALALASFKQLLRSRLYVNLVVAGVMLLGAAWVFDRLAAGEGGRVVLDVGTSFTALVITALGGIVAITTTTAEIENRQAFLVLARPLHRSEFVLARFVMCALLVASSALVLGLLLSGLLVALDASPAPLLTVLPSRVLEAWVVVALALAFGVGSSAPVTSVMAVLLFVLGRLGASLDELLAKGTFGSASDLLEVALAILPQLYRFDLISLVHRGEGTWGPLALNAAYAAIYIAGLLAIAVVRLERRSLL